MPELHYNGIDRRSNLIEKPVYLIVNADDYGYSTRVSEGILLAAKRHVISATGIMANCDQFDQQVNRLQEYPDLDLGVHLTLSSGKPISSTMREALERQGRNTLFDSKFSAVAAVLRGQVSIQDVWNEWDQQIARCRDFGLDIQFLNSHEHVHMLPMLGRCAASLAERHAIPHIRRTSAEWRWPMTMESIMRSTMLWGLAISTPRIREHTVDTMLGASVSGKLDEHYLTSCLPGLIPGRVYELMCHPGLAAQSTGFDARVNEFHDWQMELDSLSRILVPQQAKEKGIRIIGYRALPVS